MTKVGDKVMVIDDGMMPFKHPAPFKLGEVVTVAKIWRDGCLELEEYPPGKGPAAAYSESRFRPALSVAK